MQELLANQQWLLIVLVFFGIFFYIIWMRQRDRKWIDSRFGKDQIRALSFGVNYFGKLSEPGKPKSSRGFLLLLQDRLVFRSRNGKIEVEIPGAKVTKVFHDVSFKGVDLHQSLVKIAFDAGTEQEDVVAFKVPYPPQWMQAIDNAFSISPEK